MSSPKCSGRLAATEARGMGRYTRPSGDTRMPEQAWIIVGVVAVLFALVMLVVVGQFINLYIQALLSNAHVNLLDLVGMRLRKVDIRTIVLSRIRACLLYTSPSP